MADPKFDAPSLVDDKTGITSPTATDNTTPTCENALAQATKKPNGNKLNQGNANTNVKASANPLPVTKTAPRPRLKSGHSTPNMNGPLYMQTSGSSAILIRRLKRKEESTWKHLARWFVENQIGLSFNLLSLLFLAHKFIPKARVHTAKFFQLSYYNPKSGEYQIGFDDAYLIAFCIIVFTGLRAATMEYVLAPIAKAQGISKRKTLTRFSEQAWMLVYYVFFWTLGMYIYCTSPYYLNLRELWTNWPNRELDGLMKGYVLIQWAFWLQQMIVINIEERRKDHWQMFTHHIVTTILISSCYSYHHTRVGNLILVIMDVVDLFLPLAKCLKYSGFNKVCDVMFGLFVVSWFVARHIFYIMVCWSVYAHTPDILTTGCFKGTNENLIGPIDPPAGYSYLIEPYINPTGLVCYNETVKWAFLAPLLFLQGLTIVWFCMIVKVISKVLRGESAEDVRSDDEDEEEEDEFIYEEAQPLEEEVGVEQLDLRNWERRTGLKKQGSSSGVSLPGHSDRKELLGRIGCEKQVD
ncbi:Fc.00g059520.m01.CDS01 [Cosmosporella sp. VM-42]